MIKLRSKELGSDWVSLQKTQLKDHVYAVTWKHAGPSLSPLLSPFLPQPYLKAKKASRRDGLQFYGAMRFVVNIY